MCGGGIVSSMCETPPYESGYNKGILDFNLPGMTIFLHNSFVLSHEDSGLPDKD